MNGVIAIIILLTFSQTIHPQANVIQSIDFDSEQRVVYGLTWEFDYSYALRYKDGNLETWNLSQIFNIAFYWISTTIDENDNIYAFMDNIYVFDGNSWSQIDVPSHVGRYKYSDLNIANNYLWLTVLGSNGAHRLNLSDSTWTTYDSLTIEYSSPGIISFTGDSVWIPTSNGLVLIYNEMVSVILDTLTSAIPTQRLYCFFTDSNENKWLGSYDGGLIKWVNDTTFISYNTGNSNLPHNFVNAIDEDSKGNLWIGTDGGLACYKNDTIVSYSYIISNAIITLKVDHLDRIWFGDFGVGNLLMFDGTNLIIVTSVSDKSDSFFDFNLYQNYPNPFNPSTKIKFTIPVTLSGVEGSLVTLKIYDVLGKEITTLVNEEKPAGTYEIEFNSVGTSRDLSLPSGIYFYRLKTGDFVETKKMVLIK